MIKSNATTTTTTTESGTVDTDGNHAVKRTLRSIFRTVFTIGLMTAVAFGVLTVFGQIIGIILGSAATVEFSHERVLPIALIGAAVACIFSLLCTYVDSGVEETDD